MREQSPPSEDRTELRRECLGSPHTLKSRMRRRRAGDDMMVERQYGSMRLRKFQGGRTGRLYIDPGISVTSCSLMLESEL